MSQPLQRYFRGIASILVVLFIATACTTTPDPDHRDPRDPFEGFNRSVYAFNDTIDRAAVRPVAVAYRDNIPQPVRTGVGNFVSNLSYPIVIVNSALQGKFTDAFSDTGRFLINTTIGIAGIFDPATLVGLEANNEDFGQTLGVWGFGPGPYLMLPALGPSTVRDASGMAVATYVDPTYSAIPTPERYGLYLIRAVDLRAGLLEADRFLEDEFDPYVALREAYLQRRRHLIYDGDPPPEEIDYDDWDDEDDDWEW
ncbi:MlaA family lipoprotein [Natronospira bacteriovora]|uniref:VacJ family lipoprotein n=1 Tax=Natronospira bacteriovora TaxID=3069753 RepID=A0ABU0W358_9GAMM|nr:VacJ family lipoprotein [Natronospira sp. AB-CW4]MDQ2068433.1 VacJ family lipoprotein [Natronospira sp. AB-CW4]